MKFGDKIQGLLAKRGWTQGELGQNIGVSQQRISLWTRGMGEPGPAKLLAIAKSLGVPVEFLCDDSQEEPRDVAAKPAPEISEEDKVILAVAHSMGHEEAMRRLTRTDSPTRRRIPLDRNGAD